MSERLNLLTGQWERAKTKKKSPEASVGHAVDAFLKSKGAYMRTIKSGGTLRAGKWTTSQQGSGISDRIGILPGGRFIAVELKAPGKKGTLSDAQFNFLENILHRGGIGLVADSVKDCEIALAQTIEELKATLLRWKPRQKLSGSDEPLFP